MSLTTNYLGLVLRNPIVASSSPLSHSVDSIRRLEDAGASAVVMYSLFEEQITFDSFYVDHYLRSNANSFAEPVSFFPEMNEYNGRPDGSGSRRHLHRVGGIFAVIAHNRRLELQMRFSF
jgi:dihydroorotate dehydrogenase (fumarate)